MSTVAVLTFLIGQLSVPYNANPLCPTQNTFKSDNGWPGNPFRTATQTLTIGEFSRAFDRSCSVWGRVSMGDRTCRHQETTGNYGDYPVPDANSVTSVADNFAVNNHPAGATYYTNDCDVTFYFDTDSSPWRGRTAHSTYVSSAETLLGLAGSRQRGGVGNTGDFFFQGTALHEIGHTLGFSHPAICSGGAYHCPVMSGGASRGVYWPTSDEVRQIVTPREIELRWASVNSQGTVGGATFHCDIPGAETVVPPRMACAPTSGSGHKCVVTYVPSWTNSPRFAVVDTNSSSSCTVERTNLGYKWSDGAVDIAVGANGRAFGVGKRPVHKASAENVVTYAFNTGSSSVTWAIWAKDFADASSTELDLDLRTHTEPRVSYHEPADMFFVAYPNDTGNVQLLGFDSNGLPRPPLGTNNPLSVGESSMLPVGISCDTHLNGDFDYCRLYVSTLDADSDSQEMEFRRITVSINAATGAMAVVSRYDVKHPVLQINDVVTYGENPYVLFQPDSDGYWFVTGDELASKSDDEVLTLFDNDGGFNPASIHVGRQTLMTSSGIPHGYRTNLSSWDWNEELERFSLVTPR